MGGFEMSKEICGMLQKATEFHVDMVTTLKA
jgi:hypothetical protein